MSLIMAEYQKILFDNLEFAQHRLSQRSAVNQALAKEVMELAKVMIDQNLQAYEKIRDNSSPQDIMQTQREFYVQNMDNLYQFTHRLAQIIGEEFEPDQPKAS
jgi:hypothetical protein